MNITSRMKNRCLFFYFPIKMYVYQVHVDTCTKTTKWIFTSQHHSILKVFHYLYFFLRKYPPIMMSYLLTKKLNATKHLGNICLNIKMNIKAVTKRENIRSTPLVGFYIRRNWLHTNQFNGFLEFYAWNNIK